MAVIGLDVGSTGCKSILFGDDGEPLSYAYREYKSTGSIFEVNANEIWRCVCEVLKETNKSADIKALAVSSFGESFVAVDKYGTVLENTMLYSDPRGLEQCRRITDKVGIENIMKIAGITPHLMYSLPKIEWFCENRKEAFAKTASFLLIGDFITYRLCGEKCIDYSLAARTMAFDVIKKKWHTPLLNAVGIDENYMSKAVPSGTAVGTIIPKLAQELGLPDNILIITGGHDQICAATGVGITQEGYAIDGIGTVECITPVFGRPVIETAFLNNNYACVPYSLDGMYATYAVNFTGGSLLKWYRDHIAKLEYMQANERGISVYEMLDKEAFSHPTDIIVVPHFAGSGTPDMDPKAKGAIFGLSLDTDESMLYKAMLEGITYEMKYNIDFLSKAGIVIRTLKAAGGGAKSRLWLQIKADITGCGIIPMEIEEAGVTGAAMLAAVAAGVYPDLASAAKQFVHEKAVIEPNMKNHTVYSELYEKYKSVRNCAKNI